MLHKHTYKFLLAAIVLLAVIGFGLKKDRDTDTPYPDHSQAVETDIAPKPSPSPSQSQRAHTNTVSSEPTEAEKRQAYEDSLLAVLPASLKGVPSPETLDIDAAGNLVINAKIRNMFDHYLSTLGEEGLPTVSDRIKLLLQRQLSGPALSQALNIFDNYIDFKRATDGILQQSAQFQSKTIDGQTIAALKQRIRLERSTYFSPEIIAAFFTREDQYDDYMLAKSHITNDKTLSNEDSLAALAQLNQQSPAWLTKQDIQAKKMESYQAKELTLIKSGADAWDIQDLRRRELGEDAAAKLDLRDQSRADWDQRLSAYREAVATAMLGHSDQNTPRAIAKRDQIRAEHFKNHELRRVISLDAITPKD